MKQMKSFLGLLIIVICLIYEYETVENNEVIFKRVRRIIRGHLATPGQVKNKYFRSNL